VKLHSRFPLVVLAFSALATAQEPKNLGPLPIQRFVCNTGYKFPECQQQLGVLRSRLAPYPSQRLGEWTWVLVKSQDWKTIVQRLGGNSDSPAFTILERRETFLEEALFAPVGSRQSELLRIWSIPLDRFLDVAVTHELGHGICEDLDEARADAFGRLLREGKKPDCDATPRKQAKSH
jgi:hypothetical protein